LALDQPEQLIMKVIAIARRLIRVALPAIFLTGGMIGCSPPVGSVTGKVMNQGISLSSGSVILYCKDQQIVHGLIGPDGTFTVANVPCGQARATVRTASREKELWRQRVQLPPVINGPIIPGSSNPGKAPPQVAIPTRYELPEESGLNVTVSSGVTVFDINLSR
jgi:hypothetical protein